MSLIICSECGKEISDKANSCPNCGAPVENSQLTKKFCKHCGESIDKECVICPKCGKQVEELKSEFNRNIVVTNSASNVSASTGPRPKNKWVSFLLCLFLGFVGAHKFYEGKVGMGVLYILTMGLFVVGACVDLILILLKPNPYY